MATRADLLAAYTECKTVGDEITVSSRRVGRRT